MYGQRCVTVCTLACNALLPDHELAPPRPPPPRTRLVGPKLDYLPSSGLTTTGSSVTVFDPWPLLARARSVSELPYFPASQPLSDERPLRTLSRVMKHGNRKDARGGARIHRSGRRGRATLLKDLTIFNVRVNEASASLNHLRARLRVRYPFELSRLSRLSGVQGCRGRHGFAGAPPIVRGLWGPEAPSQSHERIIRSTRSSWDWNGSLQVCSPRSGR